MTRKPSLIREALELSGVRHRFVNGWETRGSSEFDPVGVTWHATAGSPNSTAQGEVNVILNGSTSAPAPIAQFMAARDGEIWIVAAGRCNHNKVGWAGPNKGLGNKNLFGIEMQNDNRGQAYTVEQLDSVRRFTAALFVLLGQDPRKRLAGHYEHQPYVGRPAGETSTKSDPYGIDMGRERTRVYAEMGELDMPSAEEVAKAVWEHRYGDKYPTMAVMTANLHEQMAGFDSKTGKNTGKGFPDWLDTAKHNDLVKKIDGVMADNDKTQTAVQEIQRQMTAFQEEQTRQADVLNQILDLLTTNGGEPVDPSTDA